MHEKGTVWTVAQIQFQVKPHTFKALTLFYLHRHAFADAVIVGEAQTVITFHQVNSVFCRVGLVAEQHSISGEKCHPVEDLQKQRFRGSPVERIPDIDFCRTACFNWRKCQIARPVAVHP